MRWYSDRRCIHMLPPPASHTHTHKNMLKSSQFDQEDSPLKKHIFGQTLGSELWQEHFIPTICVKIKLNINLFISALSFVEITSTHQGLHHKIQYITEIIFLIRSYLIFLKKMLIFYVNLF